MKFQKIKEQSKKNWDAQINSDIPKIYIGFATCGISQGAPETLSALERELKKNNILAEIIKVGCIGLCYAEPLVVMTKKGLPNICYKNITEDKVPHLMQNFFLSDDPCLDLALGVLDIKDNSPIIPEMERFEKEKRIILGYSGYIDPENIDHYLAVGGYEGLNKALNISRKEIMQEIKLSGLRGLGGAGFSTGTKWEEYHRSLLNVRCPMNYIICNADEGDPGAFMDRVVLESNPHQVIEGIIITAYALSAQQGYIYIRSEYPLAIERISTALRQAREKGVLGENILESGFNFNIEIFKGAGAFICGESTALMYSMEGKRPMPRPRPPHSVERGLWGCPTLLNNVKTFSCIPQIISQGAKWFSQIGTKKSKGTTVFTLAGKINNSGLCEVKMGTTLREVIYDIGGGIKDDKKLKAVQIGGPSGGCIPAEFISTPVDFDSLKSLGSIMGSGGLIVLDETTCMVDVAKYFTKFLVEESCGKCSFCRVGLKQALIILEDIVKGEGKLSDLDLLVELSEDIKDGSLCGLGKTATNPILTTIKYFKEEYLAHITEKKCPALLCPDLISYFILKDKCYRGCEHCVISCPAKAILSDENRIKVTDQIKCIKCGNCLGTCPKEYNAVVKVSPKIRDER